jgi:hypothetical protein
MRLEKLIELASRCAHASDVTLEDVKRLGQATMDLLAEPEPCGYEPPDTFAGQVIVPASWCAPVSPQDAQAMARMLFVQADEFLPDPNDPADALEAP